MRSVSPYRRISSGRLWVSLNRRLSLNVYADSTINRQGVRMGTSEIYRAVLSLDDVLDALVVDIPRPGTEGWMPLFVVLREGAELDDGLRREIARRVRERCSPRHVPDEVFRIAEVPRTLSGKALEGRAEQLPDLLSDVLFAPDGNAPRAGSKPRLASQPSSPRLVRQAGGDARIRVYPGRGGTSCTFFAITPADSPVLPSKKVKWNPYRDRPKQA